MVFIGPVGSSHSHWRRSGRRLNLNHNTPGACEHGVVDVRGVVVRTTDYAILGGHGGMPPAPVLEHQEGNRVHRYARLGSWGTPAT